MKQGCHGPKVTMAAADSTECQTPSQEVPTIPGRSLIHVDDRLFRGTTYV